MEHREQFGNHCCKSFVVQATDTINKREPLKAVRKDE
jgi:hypothetical protein